MPTYTYRAIDVETQEQAEGSIEASDDREARLLLRGRNLLPFSVAVLNVRSAANSQRIQNMVDVLTYEKVPPKDLALLTEQIAALIGAGIPILEALRMLEDNITSAPLKRAMAGAMEDLEAGRPFSEAISKFPRIFPPLYINMVRAGEATGNLDLLLNRMSHMMGATLEIQRKVKGALTYPAIVTVVLIIVIIAVLILVVPQFEKLYGNAHAKLPMPTQIMIYCSEALRGHFILIGVGTALLVGAFRWYINSPRGKPAFHRMQLKLPVFGPLMLEFNANIFARVFSTVYGAGIPIIEAVRIGRGVVTNYIIVELLESVEASIERGASMASELMETPYFPKILARMLAVGESSGRLDDLAMKAVAYSERELDYKIKNMTTLIEPIMTLVMGVVVMLIALAIYLPLFDLPSLLAKPH
ncbi:MAG: type II secretion system F family protein [Cyanobacteria bacterium REEB65]|nr:type II secretion system F family protein [Cyanobacteria bacterium REEB65]